MTLRTTVQKITRLPVILWRDLDHYKMWEEHADDPVFDSFTWGDAEYTLVHPLQLVNEIDFRSEVDFDLQPLLDELLSVPDGVLIAFNG